MKGVYNEYCTAISNAVCYSIVNCLYKKYMLSVVKGSRKETFLAIKRGAGGKALARFFFF